MFYSYDIQFYNLTIAHIPNIILNFYFLRGFILGGCNSDGGGCCSSDDLACRKGCVTKVGGWSRAGLYTGGAYAGGEGSGMSLYISKIRVKFTVIQLF